MILKKDDIKKNSQIVYFSHGGGPLPLLNDSSHDKMIQFMKNLPQKIHKPDSIIVFSAHWEEDIVTIQSGESPSIMYDYYGFPEAAYNIKYPCVGSEDLALRIAEVFRQSGIEYKLDDKRPYDHGSYIPLKMMYPDADIPVIQISLNKDLNSLTHLSIGKALRPLLDENLLIIGSGFSFHNMTRFDFSGKNTKDPLNDHFQDRLIDICCINESENEKWQSFLNWESFPNGRYCHPREEHLLPLLVCAGLSTNVAVKIFDDYILGKRAVAFLWKKHSIKSIV